MKDTMNDSKRKGSLTVNFAGEIKQLGNTGKADVGQEATANDNSGGSTSSVSGLSASSAPQSPEKGASPRLNETSAAKESFFASHRTLLRKHPQHLLLGLFLIVVLVGSGVAIASISAINSSQSLEEDALDMADETGEFFSHTLEDAILPLFSLAQFVNELEIFQDLPEQVGLAGAEGSLPFNPLPVNNGVRSHRNVSGVCDEPSLVQRFDKIAGDIKRNAGMDGILVALQIVPNAVVCLTYPLNNTEDFPPGVFMDNSGTIGHDLLTDPARKFIAEATVPADDVVIAGPLTLQQCEDCDPLVQRGLIVRLPISSENNTIIVNDVGYKKWGFAVGIINWEQLIVQSGVYDVFESEGMEFQLTRTDRVYNPEDRTYGENVVVLAESPSFRDSPGRQVSSSLDTTNNEWVITVTYCTDGCTTWFPWIVVAVILVSFMIGCLAVVVFSQKQRHSDMLAEKQEQLVNHSKKAAQNEKELNDFIAHEVRNPLAAALSATSFVAVSVNEREPLATEESREAVREDVNILESSLQFINDLLRSMLDLSRARSNQLVLDLVPTDIKRDILDPSASMLYNRDSMFIVDVQCAENLIMSVDKLRVQQIVLNLARNSSKFVEAGFVRLTAVPVQDGLCITVEDSGPGIPVSKREKLFSRFQDSLDELNQGTGIGLSLCKKLVDLMGGSITLDNTYHSGIPGKPGAKLDIRIKCDPVNVDSMTQTEEESVTIAEVKAESRKNLNVLPDKLNVLFVDDDVMLRKLFFRSLKRIRPNWTCKEAASGESALLIAKEENFDIIFMDQYMTSVEKQLLGTETVRRLRSTGIESIVCGLSANDMEEPFKKAGADAFMMKPFPCKPEPLAQELLRIFSTKHVES